MKWAKWMFNQLAWAQGRGEAIVFDSRSFGCFDEIKVMYHGYIYVISY